MGNYVSSCTFATPLLLLLKPSSSAVARVIFPTGELRQFHEPTKAAELMLDSPNFFLANARSLHVGRRFSALSADEDLEFGNLYLMFPMKRVNSIVTAADMAYFFLAANSAGKRISAGKMVRILPEESPTMDVGGSGLQSNNENGGEMEGFPSEAELKHRLSVCRSRKPLLETIREEPVCSPRRMRRKE